MFDIERDPLSFLNEDAVGLGLGLNEARLFGTAAGAFFEEVACAFRGNPEKSCDCESCSAN